MRILILGAGGHAQVVADILLRTRDQGNDTQPIGYLDDNPALIGQYRLNIPVLGVISQLDDFECDAVIVAIGENTARYELYQRIRHQGIPFATACHPRAVIAPDVTIGSGSVVCAGVVVNPGSVIGQNVVLNTGCTVDHHNIIADHSHIAPGVHLGGDVQIGTGALIGIGATVMPQRKVGAYSTVGAGALVYTDVPDEVTVVGVPARIIGKSPVRCSHS
jgi:sugar O-acyltransferase (sialic acid O-acetyltransferase NeuD family)